MVICLFGQRYREHADRREEARIGAELLEQLREIPGFIAYHLYTAADGEVLGVIRFETREALEAWRDDLTHRAIWPRATEFYQEFWIQNCDTYREYLWRDGRRQEADTTTMFRQADANLARTRRPFPARAAKRQGQAPVAPTSHLSRRD
jgi:heme-degrading monooxygenase HmoA